MMFAPVGTLNDTFGPDHSTSVHYTPIMKGKFEDPAHTDLTVAGPPIAAKSEQEEELVQFLQGKFKMVHHYQIDMLPPANPPTIFEWFDHLGRMIKRMFERK